MLKTGQEVTVKVLDINKEKERVSLGLKQLQSNPWDKIEERFPIGKRVKGKITNLVPYGAFVELEEGVEGLIHVSELVVDQAHRASGGRAQRRPGSRGERCWASTRTSRRFRSACASWRATRGTRSRRSTRRAPWSRARSAT